MTASLEVYTRSKGKNGRPATERWTIRFPNSCTPAELTALVKSHPANRVTEDAAIALGLVGLCECLDLEVVDIGLKGDRGDYWLADRAGNYAGMIEVGGHATASARSLFREKRKQVLGNLSLPEAYVSVTAFRTSKGYCCRVR